MFYYRYGYMLSEVGDNLTSRLALSPEKPSGHFSLRRVRNDPYRLTGLLDYSAKKDGGGVGIRTLDTLVGYTHLAGEHLRPLGHSSARLTMLPERG